MNAHVQTQLTVPVTRRDHTRGPLHAPVTLLEYGDFECPYCRTAHFIVQAIEGHMADDLCFAFRHFPLINVHPHAEHAAEAAEAVGPQQFWAMHDILFENQEALADEDLGEYAASLGLDAPTVLTDVVSGAHRFRIQQDIASGADSDVNRTPTFFINGLRYDGELDAPSLLAAIELIR